ncbi:MAG: phosphohydrolase [Deltaproteobacteria bacterium]|nr:phosphohydrolase [Deltaproteobacteria bacterium]
MRQAVRKGVVVLYHYACDDGFGAAWAAWRKFGDKARYIAVRYQEALPKGLSGRDVYLLDFSYPPNKMQRLLKTARHVVAIDHHKTADVSTHMAQVGIFDLNHAGAVLAWRHFHPGAEVPRLLCHIEDRDLWRFNLKGTNQIRAVLRSYQSDFRRWDEIARRLQSKREQANLVKEGAAILRYQERVVEQMVTSAQLVNFSGQHTYVTNTPLLSSEVCHALAEKHPPLGIVWSQRGGTIKVELRSVGNFDVSELSKKFGGGGHRNAAGFSLPAGTPFPWKAV